ncbi:hypothetical protein N431DRAFT_113732 [Stipitochalara longipes BDJ]|nr:hypothetical protein N431DRAFT_113732 [Stipitochalara longipes BDJ]
MPPSGLQLLTPNHSAREQSSARTARALREPAVVSVAVPGFALTFTLVYISIPCAEHHVVQLVSIRRVHWAHPQRKQFPAHNLESACTIWGWQAGGVRLPWGANPQGTGGTLARATTSLGLRSGAVWRATIEFPARRSTLLQVARGIIRVTSRLVLGGTLGRKKADDLGMREASSCCMVLDAGLVVTRQTLCLEESESAFYLGLPHTSLLKSAHAHCRSACKRRLGSLTGSKGVAGGLFCNQRRTCISLENSSGCRSCLELHNMRP